MKAKNVLSLFDGYSTGMFCLNAAGIPVKNYFASEIDKYAMAVSAYHFPEIIQIGDVLNVRAKDLPKIDILIAGSPCQGFSVAGKNRNFEDPRSKLLFEFIRLLKECDPEYFFLENVRIPPACMDVVSEALGCDRVLVNSSLVSAQNRQRFYWTNIDTIGKPADKGIYLKDILEDNVPDKYFLSGKTLDRVMSETPKINPDKSYCLSTHNSTKSGSRRRTATLINCEPYAVSCAMRGRNPDNPSSRKKGIETEQKIEINSTGKSNCLTTVQKDSLIITKKYIQWQGNGYSQDNRAYFEGGKSGTLDTKKERNKVLLIKKAHGFNKGGIFEAEKHGTLRHCSNTNEFLGIGSRIRRLTPLECERLQTVPDNYTKLGSENYTKEEEKKVRRELGQNKPHSIISDSQRYKMLGNGWTADVVTWFFEHMKSGKKKDLFFSEPIFGSKDK